jgi:hypothetical protein
MVPSYKLGGIPDERRTVIDMSSSPAPGRCYSMRVDPAIKYGDV